MRNGIIRDVVDFRLNFAESVHKGNIRPLLVTSYVHAGFTFHLAETSLLNSSATDMLNKIMPDPNF